MSRPTAGRKEEAAPPPPLVPPAPLRQRLERSSLFVKTFSGKQEKARPGAQPLELPL